MDHNKWVELEQVHNNTIINPTLKNLLDNIQRLVKENKLRVVANLTNLQETIQRKYDDSRKELGELIIKITDGYFFIPFVLLQGLEIRNYFRHKLGLERVNIREEAVSKGIGHLLGSIPKAKIDSIDPKALEEINKEAEKWFIKNDFILNLFQDYYSVDEKEKEKYFQASKNAQKALLKLPNDIERRKHQINVYYENFFMPRLMKAMKANDISNREGQLGVIAVATNIPRDLRTYKKRRKFMKEFPLLYTEFSLTSFKNRDIKRNIEWNDLLDIASLCVPIPYFDYVVAEKYFITLAKQAKLDEMFNTVLLTDLNELEPYLCKI